MRRRALLAGAVGAALLLPAAPAGAVDFNVSNTAQLLSALGTANTNGLSDRIFLAPGTYNLTGALNISGGDLDIIGTGSGAANTVVRQTSATRVLTIQGVTVFLDNVTITGGNVAGNGGGIFTNGPGLTIEDSAIDGNRATVSGPNAGGGGIYFGNAGGSLFIQRSSVSRNRASVSGLSSGGGGVWSSADTTIESTTLSENVVSGTVAGGGGYLSAFGGGGVGGVDRGTFADNTAPTGAGILGAGSDVPVTNSILAGSGSQCAGVTPNGNNIDSANTCGFNTPNTNPRLGPLADNGGGTRTRALAPPPGSPAIDAGTGCPGSDQRGLNDVGNSCDIGAYEFEGLSIAQVPTCSPTGLIPLGMVAPPNNGVVAFHYILNGAQTDIPTPGGGPSANTTLNIPEGRRPLEYWGEFTNNVGGGEMGHHTSTVLVDKTDPSVAIKSEQKRTIYVITRKASVDVNAADSLSGLVGNPSANGERIGTRSRGKRTVTKTATDLCGNQQTAALPYRVLGPALGTRAVLERLNGKVKIRRAGGGSATAAQKGKAFVPLSQPREIPIGSFIDTKRGTLRLTSSKSRRATAIQDGQFSGGLFQVLQSRKKRAKGLTNLVLKGGRFTRCGGSKGARAALSRRAIRRLRARAKGRFRTRGRYSAATVRGTTFTVTDRCDGTLTKVKRGRVAVRDFRLRKTVIVRAGKSYLARAPG